MQLEPDVPVMFTTKQVSIILNVSRTQVYKFMQKGEIASVKVGRSRRVTENQLVEFIRRLEGESN